MLDDERTTALGLFNTARSYRQSAIYLQSAQLDVTHPEAPVTFIFCHSIELFLKAFLRGKGHSVADLKKIGHRIADLTRAARDGGLELDAESAEILSHIDVTDMAIEARYIVTGFKTRPTNEALSKAAEELDRKVCTALAGLNLPVRQSEPIRAQSSTRHMIDEESKRVLLQLFRTEGGDNHVELISRALLMDRGILQYHLDRLADFGFAECTGVNYLTGHINWGLTSEGRRYVVENGLLNEVG